MYVLYLNSSSITLYRSSILQLRKDIWSCDTQHKITKGSLKKNGSRIPHEIVAVIFVQQLRKSHVECDRLRECFVKIPPILHWKQ